MHCHIGAPTAAEASACRARSCPSFLAPSASVSGSQTPFHHSASDSIWGSSEAFTRPLRRSRCTPLPHPHILNIRHHSKRGQPHSKHHGHVLLQTDTIQQLHKSPGRWELLPRPKDLSKVNAHLKHSPSVAKAISYRSAKM